MAFDRFLQWDRELLILINGFHTPWLDSVMMFMTHLFYWAPLYALLVYLLFRNFKHKAWLLLIGALLTILLTEAVTSEIMKPYFARLRPSHDPGLLGVIHLVDGYTGDLFGFSSGHAADTFGLALFFWFTLRPIYKWAALLFVWAGCVSYTRIYLGVHFPGDILAGLLLGLCCGVLGIASSHYLCMRFGVLKESN